MPHNRPLIFGEVLFDCFPDGREVLGGAPFNVAWNLQAFGQNPIFISRVGDDQQGQVIKNTMSGWSMSTNFLQLDATKPTGRVEIVLTNGEPHFTILPNQAYDHISQLIPEIKKSPAFLYHGTLALRDDSNRTTLAGLKRDNPCPVFLDVNLRLPWWDRNAVLSWIEDATWLKLNDDECRALFPEQENLEVCGKMLLERYNLEGVFITMGSKGALAYTRKNELLQIQPDSDIEIKDTVGAGDAFSSVLLLGLIKDWPMQFTMERAQEFASAVVGQRGAITHDQAFYKTFCDKWEQQ